MISLLWDPPVVRKSMNSLLWGPPVLSLLCDQRFGPRVPNGTGMSSNHMREICAKHELHAHRGDSTLTLRRPFPHCATFL